MAYVIVGLGNPGSQYSYTRHNAGRMAVELFAREAGFPPFKRKLLQHASVSVGEIGGQKVTLVLPEVYMNVSGRAVTPFVKNVQQAETLLVVRDELDLPVGALKMTGFGRGSGGHNGVESVMGALKTKNFTQLKIGIARAKASEDDGVAKHVLGTFRPDEADALKESLERAVRGMRAFVSAGSEEAMREIHTVHA